MNPAEIDRVEHACLRALSVAYECTPKEGPGLVPLALGIGTILFWVLLLMALLWAYKGD